MPSPDLIGAPLPSEGASSLIPVLGPTDNNTPGSIDIKPRLYPNIGDGRNQPRHDSDDQDSKDLIATDTDGANTLKTESHPDTLIINNPGSNRSVKEALSGLPLQDSNLAQTDLDPLTGDKIEEPSARADINPQSSQKTDPLLNPGNTAPDNSTIQDTQTTPLITNSNPVSDRLTLQNPTETNATITDNNATAELTQPETSNQTDTTEIGAVISDTASNQTDTTEKDTVIRETTADKASPNITDTTGNSSLTTATPVTEKPATTDSTDSTTEKFLPAPQLSASLDNYEATPIETVNKNTDDTTPTSASTEVANHQPETATTLEVTSEKAQKLTDSSSTEIAPAASADSVTKTSDLTAIDSVEIDTTTPKELSAESAAEADQPKVDTSTQQSDATPQIAVLTDSIPTHQQQPVDKSDNSEIVTSTFITSGVDSIEPSIVTDSKTTEEVKPTAIAESKTTEEIEPIVITSKTTEEIEPIVITSKTTEEIEPTVITSKTTEEIEPTVIAESNTIAEIKPTVDTLNTREETVENALPTSAENQTGIVTSNTTEQVEPTIETAISTSDQVETTLETASTTEKLDSNIPKQQPISSQLNSDSNNSLIEKPVNVQQPDNANATSPNPTLPQPPTQTEPQPKIAANNTTSIPNTLADDRNTSTNPSPTIAQETNTNPTFTSGVFTVGTTGIVSIDYLFDGGLYQGELAVFSLSNMEEFTPGTPAFIAEAARRALTNSELGNIAIKDSIQGARFSGAMPGESNWNIGQHQGPIAFNMTPGDSFGIMLIPNGTVKEVFNNPSIGGTKRPLFSLSTANPADGLQLGQIADVTGNGNTFAYEDLRADEKTDKDYNDIIFSVTGATGIAPPLSSSLNPSKEWRNSPIGKELIEYVNTLTSDNTPPAIAASLIQDTGSSSSDFLTNNPTISGTITDSSNISSFKAAFNSNSTNVELKNLLANDGSFTLTRDILKTINNGSELPDGTHTLELKAVDIHGNTSNFELAFTLDTTTSITLSLDPAFDTPPTGDSDTENSTVTLTGQAEPLSTIILLETGAIATANAIGKFQFPGVILTPGSNSFTATTTDKAGNSSTTTLTVNHAPVPQGEIQWLVEEKSFTKTLDVPPVTIPPYPSILSVNLASINFDISDPDSINDAFEIALLDINGKSLVHTIAPGRDSFFNLTEGQPVELAAGVTYSGSTITLDLSQIAPGTAATLQLRLVNNDSDIATKVGIASVSIQPSSTTTPPVATPATDNSASTPVNFSHLEDVSASLEPEYKQTSFNDKTNILYTDISVRNGGQYPVRGSLLVGIDNISDPTVRVLGTDGTTPEGIPYYNFTDKVSSGILESGELTDTGTLKFYNPSGVQFTYDLVFLSELNSAPEFIGEPNKEALVGKDYAYQAIAIDPDGDAVTYSLLEKPLGMEIDSASGKITWNQVGEIGNHSVTVQVEDGKGGVDRLEYIVGAIAPPPNRPPIFTSTPVVDAAVNTLYSYEAIAKDADSDDLTFSLVSGPEGILVNPKTGAITWTPTSDQMGLSDVLLRVADGKGGTAEQAFKVQIQKEPGNRAPIITSVPETKFFINAETLLFDNFNTEAGGNPTLGLVNFANWNVTRGDIDILGRGLTGASYFDFFSGNGLYVDLDGSSNNQAALLESKNNFVLTPGEYELQFDLGNAYINQTNTVTVTLGNVFQETFNFTKPVTSFTHITRHISVPELTAGKLSFDHAGGDSQGLQLDNVKLQRLTQSYFYPVEAVDPDSDPLKYSLVSSPPGMTIDAYTGQLTWKEPKVGLHDIAVKVEDSRGGVDAQSFMLDVANGASLGEIRGAVWSDTDSDGVRDSGETGLSGVKVYLDLNGNGLLDSSEPTKETDEQGQYEFTNLTAGKYEVREVLPDGFANSFPASSLLTGPNLVRNGSFEVGPYTTWYINVPATSSAIPFWNVTGHSVDFVGTSFNKASEGSFSIDLNGGGPGGIAQTFNTQPGKDYIVSFDLSAHPYIRSGDRLPVIVKAAAQSHQFQAIASGGQMQYAHQSWQFTASDSQTELAFISPGPSTYGSNAGPQLDNVSVVEIIKINDFSHIVNLAASQRADNIDFGNNRENPLLTNNSPAFTTQPPLITARVGELWRYDATATDKDLDALTYELLSGPDGMTVEPRMGGLVWKPTQQQSEVGAAYEFKPGEATLNGKKPGLYDVVLAVKDGRGGSDLQSFQVHVKSANNQPAIISDPNTQAIANIPYQYRVRANDADSDAIAYQLDNPPTGMSINPTTGLIRWTPATDQLGERLITVTASDGRGGVSTQSFNLTTVAEAPNSDPTITSAPRLNTGLGSPYLYNVQAIDPNGDPLSYTLITAPAGMTLDERGRIFWQPTSNQFGSNPVSIVVSDGRSGVTSQEFAINVRSQFINQPPSIESEPSMVATAQQQYQYNPIATDPDGDPLFWSLDAAPVGMSIDPETGKLRWKPSLEQVGTHEVAVRVMDSSGTYVGQAFTLNVRGVNVPPAIISTPPTVAAAGKPYSYAVLAPDPENDPVQFSLNHAPAGMNIDPNTGLIQWTPQLQQVGTQDVEILVTDASGGTAVQRYAAVVAETAANLPPAITSTPAFAAALGNLYEYKVTATDPDGTISGYQLLKAPEGMMMDPDGKIAWNPTSLQLGTHEVVVGAVDNSGSGSAQGFTLTVAQSLPPENPGINPVQSVTVGKPYRYDVKATDFGVGPLDFKLTTAPVGMTIDDEKGRLSWLPNSTNIGTHPVEIEVTDAAGKSATLFFNLKVSADNVAPQVSFSLSSDTVNVGEKVTFAVSAVDNVKVESLSLTVNGQKVALDAQGKATVPMNVVGVFTAIATAVDAAGNVGETTQTISVTTPNVATVPAIDIPTLEDGAVINATFNIIGTINSSDLNHYALEIAPLSGGEFKEIYRSKTTVENGVLAKLDPSVLANDTYILRFKVVEKNGSISTIERIVNVASEFKLGNIQLSYTDLNIPLSGIPITITRSYDSLNANAKEELGYGWRFAELDTDLRTNLRPDEVAQELEVYTVPFEQETKVFVNVPGGKREMFTFKPKPHRLSQFLRNPETGEPLLYVPTFVSGPGSTNGLTVADAPITKVGNEYYGMNGEPYNPENPLFGSRYFLTTKEGIVYEIDAKTGDLVAAKAPDGNQLTYSESGITSSQGPSVLFGRDAAGRIVTVTDPQGKQIRYDYDDKGDLIAVTNRDNQTTKYIYNDTEKPHFIQKVIDHNGQVIYQQTGLGFVNRPPVIVPGTIKTHQELEIEIPLPNFVTDPDGDNLSYQVINPVGGTVKLKADGKTAVFTPFPGVKGVANFDLIANDGYGPVQVTMQVNVSDAPLLNLDFAQLNPRLNAVENTELVVLGDFADAQDVVLPDSYLTYASSMPTVAQVDVNGVVTGVADGVAILSATRNNVQAVTAVRVGELPTPTNNTELSVAIAELYGLDSYPDAISLTEGATRKLSLGLNSDFLQPNLTADANTRYFVSNSNVLNVSPDGVITAVGVGDATVTAIYGAASVAIPVRVEAGQVGPTTLGAAGGVVFSSDRSSTVMIPPGALDEETTVSITPKNRESLSLPVPAGFEFAGAFNLDFNGGSLNLPTQLALPAPEGLAAGTQVYFMRKGAIPDETGTWNPMWLQEESGVVGADGMIRTSSPPYPGVVRPGEYAVVYSSPTGSASLVKGKLTLNYNFPLAFFGIIDPLGGIGQLIEPDNFVTTPAFTVTEDISSVKVVAVPKVGLPVVTEVGVRRNQDGILTFEANLNIPTPAASNSAAAPKLQAASLRFKDENNQPFEGNEPILFLKGSNILASNLGDPKGSRLEDLVVKFYVGDRVYEQAVLPNRSTTLGDNQFEVAVKVPNTVALGESYIFLSRRQNQLVDQNLTEPVYEEVQYNSNPIWLDTGTEYVFAALKGADAVAVLNGTDPKSVVAASSSSNLLLSTIPVGDDAIDSPRDLAVTSDGTRVYVTLEESGRVALIDPMVLQQVDTKPETPGVNPIELPLGAKPRSIVIGPGDEYAYIADGSRGQIYILDIDPFSTTYHQIINTITIDSAAPRGLRSLAISSDGRKLFVTAPGFPNSQIVVINIDPKDRPRDANQNPQHWHEMIGKIQVGAGSEGISATSDPLKMTYANSRGDNQGFGLLSVTNDDPKAFAAEVKEVPLGLGGFLDYFDVNEGVSVAITRDGSYGFIVGRNADTRFFGQEIESIDGVQAGSNIGIIKDPLINPKLVAATRPIPDGFATDLVLSNDNKYLYASYPTLSGGGGVYVFDVEEIIRTLENPADFQIDDLDRGIKSPYFNPGTTRQVSLSNFQSVPIDDINPAISIAADYGIVTGDWPLNQFTYGVFDNKHSPIGTAGTPWGIAASLSIQENEKERLQQLSQEIAELVKMRDAADNPDKVDEQLKEPSKKRDGLLRKIAVKVQRDKYGDNVDVSPVELEGGRLIFKINYQHLVQTFYGSSSVAWNIAPLEKRAVFDIGRDLASQPVKLPTGTKLTTMLGFGGTTAQGLVQPYPGDIDYVEMFDVSAPNPQNAATAIVDTLIDFVKRNQANPRVEFEKIMIRSSKGERLVYKSLSEIEKNRSTISEALQGLNGTARDFINTFWRAKVDGDRFIGITKVLGISAKQATTGEILFSTQPFSEDAEFFQIEEETNTTNLPLETRPGGAEFQTAFILKQPETFPKEKLGWYASTMRKEVLDLVLTNKEDSKSGYKPDGKYLKAAKRAFNYFMALGNIEAMEAITPIFSTLQAQVNQQVTVMEVIRSALHPEEVSTRILRTYDAEAMLNNVANIIDTFLPGVGDEVNKTPEQIAAKLRELAAQLEETSDGLLKQNKDQADGLSELLHSAQQTINRGIREMVQPILDTYLINYYQNLP